MNAGTAIQTEGMTARDRLHRTACLENGITKDVVFSAHFRSKYAWSETTSPTSMTTDALLTNLNVQQLVQT